MEVTQLDLPIQDVERLRKVLSKYVPFKTVWAYGSRVKGTASKHSDLDMVVFGASETQLYETREALEESNVPVEVQLFRWEDLPANFHANIQQAYYMAQRETDWCEMTLGDVLEIKYGKDHKALGDGSYPCLGSGGVMRFVDSFLYDDESILIPRKGTLNNIIYQNSPFWTVDTMFWSIIDKAKAFPKYLFYQLTLTDYSNLNVGSAVPSLTVPVINQIEVNLPPLPEQRAIAEVLGSLDDKIDLLHRQNQTLEALAETLFRQWFIEEADPAWEEVKLGSVIETTSGGTPSRTNPQFYENGTHCWVKSKELKGNILLDTEETITDEAIKKSSAKMLPKYSVLIAMYGANVSEYALIAKPMACNQAICALKPNDNYPYSFLFLYVKNMKEEIEAMAVGSAQQNISQILIKQLDIIPPSTKILDFHEIVNPWFLKIEANYVQIKHLEKTRDELLPKLMSGDVRVSQVNLNGETQ